MPGSPTSRRRRADLGPVRQSPLFWCRASTTLGHRPFRLTQSAAQSSDQCSGWPSRESQHPEPGASLAPAGVDALLLSDEALEIVPAFSPSALLSLVPRALPHAGMALRRSRDSGSVLSSTLPHCRSDSIRQFHAATSPPTRGSGTNPQRCRAPGFKRPCGSTDCLIASNKARAAGSRPSRQV